MFMHDFGDGLGEVEAKLFRTGAIVSNAWDIDEYTFVSQYSQLGGGGKLHNSRIGGHVTTTGTNKIVNSTVESQASLKNVECFYSQIIGLLFIQDCRLPVNSKILRGAEILCQDHIIGDYNGDYHWQFYRLNDNTWRLRHGCVSQGFAWWEAHEQGKGVEKHPTLEKLSVHHGEPEEYADSLRIILTKCREHLASL